MLRSIIFVSMVILLSATIFLLPARAQNPKFLRVERIPGVGQPAMFVEDEFILVLKHAVRSNVRVGLDVANLPTINLPSLQQVIERNKVTRLNRQFPGAATRPLVSTLPDLSGHYKVKVPSGTNLEAALADFASNPNVDHVEKIGVHPLYKDPNDPFYMGTPPQWNYWNTFGIDANLAWDKETGKSNVVVAILDTGVRYNHPDLNGNIWTNPGGSSERRNR